MRELWVSCLLFCFAVTSAEPTRIRMVVKEDSEVVLNCSASGSVRDQVFDWKKDTDVEVFLYSRGSTYGSGLSGQSPQFAGRVAHFPEALDLGNASIKIKKAEVRDSGIYTCTVPLPSSVLRSEISLVVGVCPEPLIRKIGETISRELWQCEVKGARPRPAVQWQDSSGRVLPDLETESEERDGRFYVTVRANVSRSGDYSCVVTQEDVCHQINSTTFVYIGACSEPLIQRFKGGPDWEPLQCEVKGAHPRPAVQWQDSSGRVLPALETESDERDGRFYVTVRANVSRSGDYSCVVTPKEACRQNEARTFVNIGQTPHAGSSTSVRDGVIGGVVGVFVGVAGVIVVLVILMRRRPKGELAAAFNQFTANDCTPAPDEELGRLKNEAPGPDGPV